MRWRSLCNIVIAAALLASCNNSHPRPTGHVSGNLPRGNPVTPFQPGPLAPVVEGKNELGEGDPVVAEGQRLFNQFNCSGCHAAGGGAIGPPLIDDEWIYGNSAANIFWTVMEGRPQGMPAFGGRVAEDQAWMIAAYVRSLSDLTKEPDKATPASTATPMPTPTDTVSKGRDVFLQGPCALCHTIRGTLALATVGPDLTHVASRTTLAGFLPNTRGNLAGWILNPQNLDPGTQMPPTHLEPDQLHALLDYLETLK